MRTNKLKTIIVMMMLLLVPTLVLAANDPGHDPLYIEQTGDSVLNGTLNITQNLSIQGGKTSIPAGLTLYGDGITPSSGAYITGTPTTENLYLDGNGNVYIKYVTGGDTVFIGITGTPTNLNVSGDAFIQRNLNITTNLNIGGAGYVAGSQICTVANGLCSAVGGNGNVSSTGSSGYIPVFSGSGAVLANSIVSQSGGTLTVAGNISMPSSFFIGNAAVVSASSAMALGESSKALQNDAIAIGTGAFVNSAQGISIGYASNGTGGLAIGNSAKAVSGAGISIGASAIATGQNTVAIGSSAKTYQNDDIAIGIYAETYGTRAISMGYSANATGGDAIAIGEDADAIASYAIALGLRTRATAQDSIVIGRNTNSTNTGSIAIGVQTATTANNQLMIGSDTNKLNTVINGVLNVSGVIYENNNSRVCTAANGLCAAVGGDGNVTSTGSSGFLPVLTSGTTIINSIISQSGTTISLVGSLNTTNKIYSNASYSINNQPSYNFLDDNLIAYFPFNERNNSANALTYFDRSKNGYVGTCNSAAGCNSTNGNLGNALWLTGESTSYVNLGNAMNVSVVNNLSETYSFWIKPRNYSGIIFSSAETASDSTSKRYIFYSQTGTIWHLPCDVGFVTGETVVPLNTWTHVAITINNHTNSIYVNGVLDVTQNISASCGFENSYIGTGYHGSFNGSIDEFRIYGAAFTSAQIKELYLNGINPELKPHISSTGNIGIGTTVPSSQLHVIGNANITGSAWANGSQVCTVANGLCAAVGGNGNVTSTGTVNYLPVFGSATTIINSIVSQSGSTLTVNGNISMPTSFWIGNSADVNGTGAIAIGYLANASNPYAYAIGFQAKADTAYAIAFGYLANASGNGGIAIGGSSQSSSSGTALGFGARANGTTTTAIGSGALAQSSSSLAIGVNSLANGTSSVAVGVNSKSMNIGSLAIGNAATANGSDSMAFGNSAYTEGSNAIAIGYYPDALGTGAIAIGGGIPIANGTGATSIGYAAFTNASYAQAIGYQARANVTGAIAIGYSVTSLDTHTIAMGSSSISDGTYSIAIGSGTLANNNNALAMGRLADASGSASIAIGINSNATTTSGIAIGNSASNTGIGSVVIGSSARADSTQSSVAIGANSYAGGGANQYSTALGATAHANGSFTIAIGPSSNANNTYAIATGYQSSALAQDSIAIGRGTFANSTEAITIGEGATVNVGSFSIAIGSNSIAQGASSVALGNAANASLTTSVAVGANSVTINGANALGYGARATGGFGNAFGYGARAEGGNSIAIGQVANASGSTGPIAIGYQTISIGNTGSIALGYQARSTATYATAIGYQANASAQDSFAIGRSATTNAANQLIIGDDTVKLNTIIRGQLNVSGAIYELNGSRVCTAANGLCAAPGGSGNLSSVGSAGYIPQFQSGTLLNSSAIYQSGSNIGIGTVTPTGKLSINGGDIIQTQNITYTTIASTELTTAVNTIFSDGEYVFLGLANDSGNEFRILDITNRTSLTNINVKVISGLNLNASVNAIKISGKYAYLGLTDDGGNQLRVVDISNITNPTIIGGIDLGSSIWVQEIYLQGKYIYLITNTNDGQSFKIIDVSNPTNPILLGTRAGYGSALFVQGKYAFVSSDSPNNMNILDISDPVNIKFMSAINTPCGSTIQTIAVSGKFAYVGCGSTPTDFNTYDISDVSNPIKIANITVSTSGTIISNIEIQGKYAYLTGYGNPGYELFILDLSYPYSPTIIGGIDLGTHFGTSTFTVGKKIILGTSNVSADAELKIIELNGIDTPSARIGSLETGTLHVENLGKVRQLLVDDSINVGQGGIYSQAAITATAIGTGSSTSGFDVINSTGGNLFRVSSEGKIGINTLNQTASLQVNSSNALGSLWIHNTTGSTQLFVNGSSGKIGMGTDSPVANLHVKRGALIDTITSGLTGNHTVQISNALSTANENGLLISTGRGGNPDNWILAAGWINAVTGVYQDYFRVQSDGNIGIGAPGPVATLQINSSNSAGSLWIHNTTGSTQLFINGITGNVGIGTTGPTEELEIQAASNPAIKLKTTSTTDLSQYIMFSNTTDNVFQFYVDTSGNGAVNFAYKDVVNNRILGIFEAAGAAVGSNIQSRPLNPFEVQNGSGAIGFVVKETGNVGIGTTTPAAALHVQGNVILNGTHGLIRTDAGAPFVASGISMDASAAKPYVAIRLGNKSANPYFAIYDNDTVGRLYVHSNGIVQATNLTDCQMIKTDSSGNLQCVQNSRVRVTRTGGQATTTGAWTQLNFTNNTCTSCIDANNDYNLTTGVYKVPSDGFYHLSFGVCFEGSNTVNARIFAISYNGNVANYLALVEMPPMQGGFLACQTPSTQAYLTQGTNVSTYVYQDSGGTINITKTGSELPYFSAYRLN